MLLLRPTTEGAQNMVRSALSKVAWVGRTASMVFGLALVMALVLGVASMAFGANGQNFILGKLNNAATRVTGLVGNVDGAAALRVTNPNAGTNDTALDLRVQAGEAPMKVDSATRVANLNAATAGRADSAARADTATSAQNAANAQNADKLDGVDSAALIRWASIYERSLETTAGAGPDESAVASVGCDHGDTILSGGFTNMDNGTHLIGSWTGRGTGGSHFVEWRNNATVDTVEIIVKCADTTP
jgi:hypothetical protein